MKKSLNFLIAFLLCTGLQAQTYKLSLNLVKGKDYYQTTDMLMSIKQTVNGQEMNINMNVNGRTKFHVTSVEGGVYGLDVSYLALGMKMEMPMGAVHFDSESSDTTNAMTGVLRSMKGKSFQIKMTKDGKVTEVKNIDALMASAFESSKIPADQQAQMKAQVMQSYGEKAFKSSIESLAKIFPDKPVSKGESWKINNQVASSVVLDVASVYKLDDIVGNAYLISGTGALSSANKDAYQSQNGVEMRVDISGTQAYSMKLDKASGWIIEATTIQDLKGNTYLKASEQLPQGMTIPMELKGNSTIKGI